MGLLSLDIIKIAKSIQLKKLIKAKQHSDKNEYGKKNTLLAELLDKYPKEFKVDSITNAKYVGLTHKPTGFKIHAPRTLIPIGIEHKQASMKNERVRVVLPYKGGFLLEKLNNPNWPANIGKIRHIGGGIEKGETPVEAAVRELHEEIGAKVNPNAFKYLCKYKNQHYLELTDHDIQPGHYRSTFGSDPIITLEHTSIHSPDYIGPSLKKLYNK